LRHEAAKDNQNGGKDHQVTHDATLDTLHSNIKTADNTTAPAKSRLTTPAEAAILAKRMSEALTPEVVMRGLDPRIHQSS
jgi:hypothetical protein